MRQHCPVVSRTQFAEHNVPKVQAKILGQSEHLHLHHFALCDRLAIMRVQAVPEHKNFRRLVQWLFMVGNTPQSDGSHVIKATPPFCCDINLELTTRVIEQCYTNPLAYLVLISLGLRPVSMTETLMLTPRSILLGRVESRQGIRLP